MHGGVGNEDKEAIQQRLKMIDEVYPGPKTAGFYEEIERAGFAIERPPLQRTSEHEVRDVLDRIAGRFVANGSYDEAFTSLRPLAVKFEYGLAPDPTQPLPPGLVMPTLNREELKLYPLAKDINAICWHLAERAPRILAESFMQDVGDDTWQRDMGFTLNDMRLDADVERKKKERKDRERKRDDGDGGGRLRSFQYTTSLLPMILSWISHLA